MATKNVTDTLCANAAGVLACLRKADFADLNNAINASLSIQQQGTNYWPVIDGEIVARVSLSQLLEGAFFKIPYVLGTNNDEGAYFIDFGINNDADLAESLASPVLNDASIPQLMASYPLVDPDSAIQGLKNSELNDTIVLQWKRAATLSTDIDMEAPTRKSAQIWMDKTSEGAPIYISNANTTNAIADQYLGAIPYMFYSLNGSGCEGDLPPFVGGNPFLDRPQSYLDMAAVMSGFWVGYFNGGVPQYKNPWPAYNATTDKIMILDAQPTHLNVRVGTDERVARLDLVNSILYG
ncbi:hypothetical protein LTR41_010944 [Exophiala xenobiotica]|nr:hypothetical protein LTR41_010944 [Exophiala xenobiotica]KAK5551112.1 hypothetical protein LTR46_010865 [Exophiala xenobiotica]